MIVPYSHVLALAGIVFLLGMICAVSRRNLIMILLGLEIMLNAAAIALVGASLRWLATDGQAMALFIIVVAAAEVSVGLALIVSVHRRTGSIDPAFEEPAAPENSAT
jgi:NADH-quinone oxidoreductase subunit K